MSTIMVTTAGYPLVCKAFEGSTDEFRLRRLLQKFNEDGDDEDGEFLGHVINQINNDDTNEMSRLLHMYLEASPRIRAVMDSVLVCLCGWTFGSLIIQYIPKISVCPETDDGTIFWFIMNESEPVTDAEGYTLYFESEATAWEYAAEHFWIAREDSFTFRWLTEGDATAVQELDDSGDFEIVSMLDGENYAFGVFDKGKLVGYCTLGCADVIEDEVGDWPGYCNDSMLLSDVFILPEYRHKGLGRMMIQTLFEKSEDAKSNLVFIGLLDDALQSFYEPLGFISLKDGYMVRKP